ncbi:MAG: tetratricopeptide repeat protein [Saprospiraceae bacterium]|nr:tetratricopeptide repeat protein [Saprospiraceae bacterium]MBK7738138.1 tetratricopeptide repeat protein [Saprospiraceae bacterium]MBK7913281.1 tetratricopeptide repeat protein [Saprospiraceae bacterium]
MPKRTKPDHILSKLITEFEEQGQILHKDHWEEKSYIRLIQHYEKQCQLDKALEVTGLALRLYQYKPDFFLIKAKLLLSLQKPQAAISVLDQAYAFSPFDHEISLLKAKAFALSQQFDESIKIIYDLKCTFSKSDLTELLLVEAFIYETMKDFNKMFDTLKEALTLNPNNHEALEQIWVSVEFSKKYDESVKLHQEIIDKNPYSYLAWYNLGHAYSCLGEYEKAVEALEYSFLINSHFEQGYLDCAELCLQVNMYEKALRCYQEANEMFGPDAELIVYIAECLIKLNRHKEAKLKLQKAIYHDPYNEEIFYYLGECYMAEESWKKAIKAYLEAIDLDDQREEFHAGIALAYEKIGNLRKAETHYRKSANCGLEQSRYWCLFISFLLKNKLFEKAEKTLLRADKYSFGADLLYCRTAFYLLTDSRENGLATLEEALLENSSEHTLLFNLIPELKEDREVISMIRYFSLEENKN